MNNTLTFRQKVILTFVTCVVFAVYFTSTVGIMNSGDAPQYALIRSLVENHTTSINGFMDYVAPDYAEYNGKYYLDREPGVSLLMIPAYILAKRLVPYSDLPYGGKNVAITNDSKLEAITYGLASFPIAFVPVLFVLICVLCGASFRSSLITSIFLAFGTLLWKYSANLNRVAYTLLFFEILLILLLLAGRKKRFRYSILFGFFSALSMVTDHLSIAVIVLFATTYVVYILVKTKTLKAKLVHVGCFIAGLSLPLSIFFAYNVASFGKGITSSRFYFVRGNATTSVTFIADLGKTIPVNLFSYKPIPTDVFNYIYRYPQLSSTYHAYVWPSIYTYKGIFAQSPILFMSVIGLFFIKRRRLAVLFVGLFLLHLVFISKISFFFSPNNYDSRFMLPGIIFLFVGTPLLLDKLKTIKIKVIKWGGYVIVAMLGFISLFNGLESIALHYAPHVSGEHRLFQQGVIDIFYVNQLLIHAFPNIYNLPIVLILSIPLIIMSVVLFRYQEISRLKSRKKDVSS